MPCSKSDLVCLFRGLLKEGKKLPDYNLRSYVQRRAQTDFRKTNLSEEQVESLYAQGKKDFEVLKRQLAIQNMYHGQASYMETMSRA